MISHVLLNPILIHAVQAGAEKCSEFAFLEYRKQKSKMHTRRSLKGVGQRRHGEHGDGGQIPAILHKPEIHALLHVASIGLQGHALAAPWQP
jgi:hypothetical protein